MAAATAMGTMRPLPTTIGWRRPCSRTTTTIRIHTRGRVPAQLLRRHWVITDANGKVQEVHGEGVVGEQPWLRPGEDFRYTSGAVLETALGTMQGRYDMLADDGTRFDAPIAPFTLSVPRTLH